MIATPPRTFLRRVRDGALAALSAIALAIVFSNTPIGYFFATRAVVMLRIGSPGTIWKGPIPMLMGIAGTFVYSLPLALLLVVLCRPLLVAPAARADAWRRAPVSALPWLGLTLALLAGSWLMAIMFSIAALAVLARGLLPAR